MHCDWQMVHVLYFSKDLFRFYVNPDTDEPVGEESILVDRKIVSQKVVEAARQHFGCPSVEGVALEDSGGEGSAGSHWESRILNNELMVGWAASSQQLALSIPSS